MPACSLSPAQEIYQRLKFKLIGGLPHEGWLLTMVDQQAGPADFKHALWIIDAGNPCAGTVAKIAVPHRLRPQVHGRWVSAAEFAAAQ